MVRKITLAKAKEPLHIRWSRKLNGMPTSLTITKYISGHYFVSLTIEEDITPWPEIGQQVGMDGGLLDAIVLSTGEKVGNSRFFCKDEKRLSKQGKGSKNRDKARIKVVKIHAKMADRRQDFIHKFTTRLIRENQVISLERLQVKNMIQNHLAKFIADVAEVNLSGNSNTKQRGTGERS